MNALLGDLKTGVRPRLLLLAIAALFLTAEVSNAGPAEQYVDAQLRVVRSLEGNVDHLAQVADESAARLLEGGKLHLAGERGMVSELLGRAGGLCAAATLPLDKLPLAVGAKDVVLLSDYGEPGRLDAAVEKLARSGALVIVFASGDNPLLQRPLAPNLRAVAVDIPVDGRGASSAAGQPLMPLAAPAIATAQWAYVAELLGACRRQRKQLAVYLSINLDEGRRRYDRTKGLLFEPDARPEPVPRGQYARAFLAAAGRSLEAVRKEEAARIRQAAAWIREARDARRKVVRTLQGHLPPCEVSGRGDPAFFTHTTRFSGEQGEKWIRENLREGDVYLLLGYQQNEDALAGVANALGARTIFLTATAPGAEQAKSPRHLYVNPHWPLTDACLKLSGYDVNACPLSAILGLTCYYAICAEVVREPSGSRQW